MPRETVSVNHRYVRTLLNALVLQCGSAVKAEDVLNRAWEPGMKPEDKERLTSELQKLQNHPLVQTAKPAGEVPREAQDPLEEAGKGSASTVTGDLNDVLGELLGYHQPTKTPPPSPLLVELQKYAEAAANFFAQKRFLKSPLDNLRVVEIEGEKYVFMYTAVLRKGLMTINLNGTSGSAKKLLDLDHTYLAFVGGRRCVEHEATIEGYHSATFMAFAAKLVPGRNYRFWVSKRENSESQDLLKIYTTMGENGCVVDSSTITLRMTWPEYLQIF